MGQDMKLLINFIRLRALNKSCIVFLRQCLCLIVKFKYNSQLFISLLLKMWMYMYILQVHYVHMMLKKYHLMIFVECLVFSNYPNNMCVSSSCGQYSARYYNSSGMNVTKTCSRYIL